MELRIPPVALVVNGVLPRRMGPDGLSFLERLLEVSRPREPAEPLLRAGLRRASREAVQARQIARLREAMSCPFVELPHLFEAEIGRPQITRLAALLSGRDSGPLASTLGGAL